MQLLFIFFLWLTEGILLGQVEALDKPVRTELLLDGVERGRHLTLHLERVQPFVDLVAQL